MKEMAPLLWNTILPALLSALAPALLWLLTKVGAFFKAKAEAAKQGSAENKVFDALLQLETLASNTVAHLNGSLKEKLQGYLADGVLTEEEKAELKAAAMATLTSESGPEAIALLKKVLGSAFEAVISGAIEKAVAKANESKLQAAVNAGAVAAAKVKNLDDALKVISGAP